MKSNLGKSTLNEEPCQRILPPLKACWDGSALLGRQWSRWSPIALEPSTSRVLSDICYKKVQIDLVYTLC